MTIHVLPSARLRDAEENLKAFVAKGRASTAFGKVEWEQPVWNGLILIKKKRSFTPQSHRGRSLHFLTGQGGERGAEGSRPLNRPFADFVKALLRLREETSPQHIEIHRFTLQACRLLHDELECDDHNPCLLTPRHFDAAAKAAMEARTETAAYGIGKHLALVARWLDEYGISRVRLNWKNKIPRPSSDERFGKAAEENRSRKLPSAAALDALPKIAQLVDGETDILLMRVIELLVCGGWRINELLSIPENCEVEDRVYEDRQPKLDPNGQPMSAYGIRYFAEKNFGPTIKWIPTPMVDVAKRAIRDIRRITDPVRKDAIWMAENPGRVNVPGLDAGDPDERIIMAALCEMLGLGETSGSSWCAGAGVPTFKENRNRYAKRGDICVGIRSKTPIVPESYPVRLEEHMFLIRNNFTRDRARTVRGTVRLLTLGMVSHFLSGHLDKPSVFQKYGFTEPDGGPIRMNTHQFRHWLNTLAQEGGMSQELIARWSGRKDIGQNAAYDHVSGRKLAEKVRKMVDRGEMKGRIAEVADRLPPADRQAFLDAQIASAHVTDIGLCVHDWSLAPCPTHGDCTNCNEHMIDKGNEVQRVEAEKRLVEVDRMLAVAESEMAAGSYGASRWAEAHRRQRDGLKAIVAIHDDPEVANGTLVHTARGPVIGANAESPRRQRRQEEADARR